MERYLQNGKPKKMTTTKKRSFHTYTLNLKSAIFQSTSSIWLFDYSRDSISNFFVSSHFSTSSITFITFFKCFLFSVPDLLFRLRELRNRYSEDKESWEWGKGRRVWQIKENDDHQKTIISYIHIEWKKCNFPINIVHLSGFLTTLVTPFQISSRPHTFQQIPSHSLLFF